MLNSIKTEDQRMTVEIGMDCIMPGIEIANCGETGYLRNAG